MGQPLPDLLRLANTSATPNAFAATLVAERTTSRVAAGHDQRSSGRYNALVPGPLIDVFEGDTVRIRLDNHLSQETTVHWHGLPVPPAQDGNPMDPIAPGASRTYEFTLPVGSAGTYWYHPHPHEFTAEQVFRGMAGLLIVRSRTDPVPAAIEEKLLVISDLRLAADGTIPANTPMDWQNGREGNYVLVNGQYQPVLDDQSRPESTLADPECDQRALPAPRVDRTHHDADRYGRRPAALAGTGTRRDPAGTGRARGSHRDGQPLVAGVRRAAEPALRPRRHGHDGIRPQRRFRC